MPPHTPTFPCFHSTESTVQRLRVLSGQQTGRRRAGWRSGKSWALNFRNKLASYQDCYSFSLAVFSSVLSPLIHKPQEALNQSFLFQFSLSSCALLLCSYYFYQSCVLLYILPILTSSDFCFPLLCYRQGSFFSLKRFYWTSSIKTYWSSIWRKYWIHVLIYRARRTILFPSFYNLNLRLSIHQGALKIRYQISGNVRIDFKAKLH